MTPIAPTYRDCDKLIKLLPSLTLLDALKSATNGRGYTRDDWRASLKEGLARHPEYQAALDVLILPTAPADVQAEVLAAVTAHPGMDIIGVCTRTKRNRERVQNCLMALLAAGKLRRTREYNRSYKWFTI